MTPEFRAGERVVDSPLVCTECGRRAQGNHSWADGSGEICDTCVVNDEGLCQVNPPKSILPTERLPRPEVPTCEQFGPSWWLKCQGGSIAS